MVCFRVLLTVLHDNYDFKMLFMINYEFVFLLLSYYYYYYYYK